MANAQGHYSVEQVDSSTVFIFVQHSAEQQLNMPQAALPPRNF